MKLIFALSLLLGFPIGLSIYVFLVEPLWVLPWLEWFTPGILYRVKTREALVALSFDDGPHGEFTPQVLQILERFGAKATFFLIGERAERHPELVERIRAVGHEIGNHYSENRPTLRHSGARFVEELEKTERAAAVATSKSSPLRKAGPTTALLNEVICEDVEIEDAATPGRLFAGMPTGSNSGEEKGIARREHGEGGEAKRMTEGPTQKSAPTSGRSSLRFFRAPGGVAWPWQLRLARERGYTCVVGCAYPHDPMRPPVKYIRWLIEKNLVPGTIVILHDGIRDASRSVAVLPQILEEGKRRGLRFVSIGELVDSRRKTAGDDL
jgi:peptidoglycan/xylan/chitin deacetylase (PgdA/CDA1 family)